MKNTSTCLLIISLSLMFLLPFLARSQGVDITSSGDITAIGSATIEINNGGFINNGTYTKGTETVTFSGTTASIITGGNTDMYNLSVTNTGGITTQLGLLTAHDLTIGSGCTFTMNPSKALTVSSSITNNAGNTGFVLQSGATGTASLIHNSTNVPATVQRYISGSAEAWHFLSSPVSAQAISGSWLPSGTYGNGTGYDLYLWNEPNNCWIYKLNTTTTNNWSTVHPGSNFAVGRGYLYSVQATNPTKEFIGNLNNGSLSYGLTFSSIDLTLKGFNLVGNPYPSSIDWSAASGWTRSNLLASGSGYDMWIWNPAAGNYGVCNSFTGSGTNDVTQYIAPMQGFFVRAVNAGDLTLDNDVRVHNVAADWKSAHINPEKLSLTVESTSDKTFDEIQLLFGYPANQTGAAKLFSPVVTAPGIFIPLNGANYSVRYLTDTVDNPIVPVMFKPGRDGNYMIKWSFDYDEFETIILEDRQTSKMQNMKTGRTYNFTASKTDNNNRFLLHFTTIKNQSDNELPAKIFADGTSIMIDLISVQEETEVFIYDEMGRTLLQQKLQGAIKHTINFKGGSQLLIVCLKSPGGNLCRKLLWRRN